MPRAPTALNPLMGVENGRGQPDVAGPPRPRYDEGRHPHKKAPPVPTDLDNAKLLVATYGDIIRYLPDRKAWLLWDGTRWVEDPDGGIIRAAGKITDLIADTDDSARYKWAVKSRSLGRIKAMIELAQSEPGISVSPTGLDVNRWALNTPGGILDLETNEVRPHDPAEMHTKITRFAYDPAAACPNWEAFVSFTMGGDAEKVRFVQRALGWSLTGDVSERAIFLLIGGTATGKGTTTNVFRNLMGDYGIDVDTQSFAKVKHASGGGVASPDIARLKGARFVTASESEAGHELAAARIKKLTGGEDVVTARFLYGKDFSFQPECKIFFSTNFPPDANAADGALFGRIQLLRYDYEAVVQDKQLGPRLERDEAAGILNWALAGLAEWRRIGLSMPASMRHDLNAYQMESDWLWQFGEDTLILDDPLDYGDPDYEPNRITVKEMRDAYVQWCKDNGTDPVSAIIFNKALKQRTGIETRKAHGGIRYWPGIGLQQRGGVAWAKLQKSLDTPI